MRSRRVRGLLFVGLVCTLTLFTRKTDGQSPTPWPPDASQYKLYMIGNAHIDIPWLWPWPESMSVGLSTFRSALERMNEFTDFKFSATSAQLYEWAAAADPNLIAQIRRRVAEGRWNVFGGWWVEPDVNMPSGESLIRQGLYGQRAFQQLLGRTARVGANPDSFGHPGTLPQILKLQGMDAYTFLRPNSTEKPLPADVFWWQGEDGTRVLAYRISYSYGLRAGDIQPRMHDFLAKKEPTKDLMIFYGTGDHGGGRPRMPLMRSWTRRNSPARLKFSSALLTPTLAISPGRRICRLCTRIYSTTRWAATRRFQKSRRITAPRRRHW